MHQTTTTLQETDNEEQPYMTSREVMRYLKISRSTMYRLMRENRLKGYKINNASHWKFLKSEVHTMIQGKDE